MPVTTSKVDELWDAAPAAPAAPSKVDELWDAAPAPKSKVDELWDAAPSEPTIKGVTQQDMVATTRNVLDAFTGAGSLASANQIFDDAQRQGVLADPEVRAFLNEKNVSTGNDFHQFLQGSIPTTSMLESGETAVPKQLAETSRQMNSPMINLPKPENRGVVSGAVRGAENVLEGLTSPTNVLMLAGLGGAPAVIQKLAGIFFAAQMTKGAGDKAAEIVGEANQMTPGQISEKSVEAFGEGTLGLLGLKHAAGRPSGGGSTVAERPMSLQPDGAELAARENQLRTLQRGVDERGNLLPEKVYQGDAKSADPDALEGIALSYAKQAERLSKAPDAEKPAIQAELDRLDEQLMQFDATETYNALAKARLPGEEALPSNVTPFPEQRPTQGAANAAPTTETPSTPKSEGGPPPETPPSQEVSTAVKPAAEVVIDDVLAKAAADSAERIADQVTQGQPTTVREAARDAALDTAMSSLRGGKSPNVKFMRLAAQEAAGKAAGKQGESLDAPVGESEKTKLDTTPAPEPAPENKELLSAMDRAIAEALPERDAAILNGFKQGKTLDAIAAEVGLTQQRVSQIVKAALPKLKKALEDAGFTKEDYLGGPGAMGPVEKLEMDLARQNVSIANADVNARRAAEGNLKLMDEERKANPQTWAEVEGILEKDPTYGSRLVDELRSGKKESVSDVEQAALIHEATTVKNARDAAAERAADPLADEAERAEARAEWQKQEDRLNEVDQATKLAGTSAGRALQIRKMQISENFTYEGIARRERMVKGRGLTPEEDVQIQKQAEEIKAADEKVTEAQAKAEQVQTDAEVTRMYEATINELGKEFLRDPETGVKFDSRILGVAEKIVKGLENQADAALKRIRARRAEGRLNSLPVEDLVDYSIVGASKIARKGLDFTKWSAEMIKDLGDMSADVLKEVWDASNARLDDLGAKTGKDSGAVKKVLKKQPVKTPVQAAARAKAEATAGEVLSGRTVDETVKAVINSGIHGENPVMAEAHRILQEAFPDLTEREMRNIYSKYGQVKLPSTEATKVEMAELRNLTRLQESINRLKEDLDPLKTGLQRDKATQAIREKTAQLNELLKKREGLPSPEKLATRDEAKQTRLKNAIEDLDKQLRTGEKPVKGAPAPDSMKTEQLRAELQAMRDKLKEIEEAANPGKTAAEKQVEQLAKVRDRLSDTLAGKRPENAPKDWNPLSAAAEDLKAEILGMQELAAQLKRDAKPPTDPNATAEKTQIRALEDAIRKYEDKIAKGDFSPSGGRKLGPDTAKVAALKEIRDARKAAYEAAKKAGKPILTPEERYNATRLKAVQKRIAVLEAMKANAFTKGTRFESPKLNREVLSAMAKADALRNEVNLHLKEQELRARPLWRKALSQLNQVRGIILGSDIGVLTRQGMFSWARPATAVRATANALKAAVSPEAMGRWAAEVQSREINGVAAEPIRKKSGLQMTDTVNHPEELVITRLLSRIPDFNVGGKTVRLSAVGRTLERFQTTFINSVRADLFDAAIKKGYSPEELKDRASFINSVTGRSNVKYVPEAMQAIFTSPRYEISRWETLASPITNLAKLRREGKWNRAAAANLQDIGVTAAGALALFFIAQNVGGYQVDWNPTSSDFLKMRKGNDVWDVSAGLAPRLRDVMRLVVAITHPDYKNNIGKVLLGMLLRTINPAIKTPIEEGSVALQKARGETPKLPFSGFHSEEDQHGLISLAPLIVQSTLQALKDEGVSAAAWTAVREFVGSSVNRYPQAGSSKVPSLGGKL